MRWPVWKDKITQHSECEVWFKTGRRTPDVIRPGIPVIVLATHGLGIVAEGITSSSVELRIDPDWMEASAEFAEECKTPMNRVRVRVKRKHITLTALIAVPAIGNLHRRRETTTWLDEIQYKALASLL